MSRIILADDEIHILKAAEFKLKRGGHDVLCAANGEEAWKLLQQGPADLLITDLQMPQLNGLQLLERVRAAGEFADLPAILLTAKGFELEREQIISSLRLYDILSKPFSPRELCQHAEQAITHGVPVRAEAVV